MVLARHWIEYVRLLRESAVQDLDEVDERIGDAWADLRISKSKNPHAAENLQRERLRRIGKRAADARERQELIRHLLLLDEDPDER